jgi:pyridoxine 5-phosphate synthase
LNKTSPRRHGRQSKSGLPDFDIQHVEIGNGRFRLPGHPCLAPSTEVTTWMPATGAGMTPRLWLLGEGDPVTGSPKLRLGVNIDHVATVRNARGGRHPDPLHAAEIAIAAGADGITAHLREDRRHIRDDDIARLKARIDRPLNLEMAATREMVDIALRVRPHAACIVPERREERTTEGGLDAAGQRDTLGPLVSELRAAGIRVSLFIAAQPAQIEAAAALNVPAIEIHTGTWCEALAERQGDRAAAEFDRIRTGATLAHGLGLEVHAGHGLDYLTAGTIAGLPELVELNIGHFIVGEAIMGGLAAVVRRMRASMERGRTNGYPAGSAKSDPVT